MIALINMKRANMRLDGWMMPLYDDGDDDDDDYDIDDAHDM